MHSKRSIWTWLSLGALVALLGAGLFAATSDAITSQGNSGETNAYVAPVDGVDIRGVVVQDATLCNGTDTPVETFTDGPLPAIVTGSWDVNADQPVIQSATVCFWNAGTVDGTVLANVSQSSSVEVGDCEPGESTAGDTTCLGGGAGELSAGFGEETSAACPVDWTSFRFTIPAGGFCDYRFDALPLYLDGTGQPTTDPSLAQTDAVTFDLTWAVEQVTCDDPGADSKDAATDAAWSLLYVSAQSICDDDWYQLVDLNAGEIYQVELQFTHADGDLDLFITDESGNVLGSGTTLTDDETVQFVAPATGSTYIEVRLFSGGTTTYTMFVSGASAGA